LQRLHKINIKDIACTGKYASAEARKDVNKSQKANIINDLILFN